MQPILGFLPGPGASINAVPVLLMPLLWFRCPPARPQLLSVRPSSTCRRSGWPGGERSQAWPSVKLLDSSLRWSGLSAAASQVPLLSSSPTPSFAVALSAAHLYLVDAPAGLAASALNCGPLSNCLIAPRVGQVCLLHGLQGTAALPTHCSVLKRVCASIQTYSPLYKHCHVSPEVFFASKYNEMRAEQYANGLLPTCWQRQEQRSHTSSTGLKTDLLLSRESLYLV